MKKLLTLAALFMMTLVACEPNTGDDNDNNGGGGNENTTEVSGTMTVTSNLELSFTFFGGEGVITYTLEGNKEGDKPTAKCEAKWITDLTVGENITFNVVRNDNIDTREATITLAYGLQRINVSVFQMAGYANITAEVEAQALNGEYERTGKTGSHNYFAILSQKGTTGWFDLYIDAYYRLDIFSDVAPAADGKPTLPVGVYTLDPASSEASGTFAYRLSARLECFEDGGYQENFFNDGILVVTETGLELYVTLKNSGGEVHHVVYEGSLELGYLEVPAPDHYTSLTEDYTFEHTGGNAWVFYYGDYNNNGLGNWSITTMECTEPINGDYFLIDITVDELGYNTDNVFGEYTAVATVAELKGGNFLGGVFGSWYYLIEDDYFVQGAGAPLASGTVKFEKSGVGCRLTIDCVDDLGYSIKGTFDCSTMEFFDRSEVEE